MRTATGRDVPILRLTSIARPYVYLPAALEDVADPSPLPVDFALPEAGALPTVWVAGGWWRTAAGVWTTRILIGPGSNLDPGIGNYDLHCRIDADPQLFEDIVARVVIG